MRAPWSAATKEPKVRVRRLAGSGPMTVSTYVPGPLVQSIERRIARGEYRSKSDYVLCAIRDYEKQLERKGKNR